MNDCVFCKIIAGDMPSQKAYEDDDILAIWDVAPLTPVHIIVMPKRHVVNLSDAANELSQNVLGQLLRVAAQMARKQGMAESGYRVVINNGEDAKQSVWHLHVHVLGGKRMSALIC